MARPLRIVFPGAWYHIVNRGASRAQVFRDDVDVRTFLDLLAELPTRFGVEVHGYCAMGNHYHVLVCTPEANLSRAMRHLDGVLTQRLNRRHGTDGAVFRGRFRAVLVQADRHLVAVSRYIHLNPVEAGLARTPQSWPWSSYRAYLDPRVAPEWLSTAAILQTFGATGARGRYRAFVEAGLDPGTRDFYGRPRWRAVLGDDEFIERVRRDAAALDDDARRELPEVRALLATVPLEPLAATVSETFGLAADRLLLSGGDRSRRVALARGAFVHLARGLGGRRLSEIASFLGYSTYACASQAAIRFAAEAERDPEIRRLAARIGERCRERVRPPTIESRLDP